MTEFLEFALTKEQGGEWQGDADMIIWQVIGTIVNHAMTSIEVMRSSASVAAIKCLGTVPTVVYRRNGFGADTVEGAGKGLSQCRRIRQNLGLHFIGQRIGDREGILPTGAPGVVIAPSEEVAEQFIKKRAKGRVIQRVVFKVRKSTCHIVCFGLAQYNEVLISIIAIGHNDRRSVQNPRDRI